MIPADRPQPPWHPCRRGPKVAGMTDKIALWIFVIVVALIGADLFMGWGGTLFVLRKLADLITNLMFWR